jgi:glycosyltransferase involved in cell wall biosynthesis
MKILVIHQYFVGPGQPGGSRFNEFARFWREAGHDVEVVAGSLDYATGTIPSDLAGRWRCRRVEDGTNVTRCYVPATYNRSYPGRMWAFFAFGLSSTHAAIASRRPDVVIATSPPLTASITGWCAAKWHRVPWVFEIRDIWPESAITTGVMTRSSLLARLLFRLERFACHTANAISVLTPAFAENVVERGLSSADKVTLIPNGADLDLFWPESRDNAVRAQYGWGRKTVALYAGAHGRANAISQLVDTAERLRRRDDILLVTVGDGPERGACEAAAAARGLKNIQFLGVQPKAAMPEFINAADVCLAVLQNNPTFRTVYPNKVFDYMSCERPAVIAIDGVARELVCQTAKAGVFARPEDPDDIAARVVELADDPDLRARLGASGRAWVIQHASRRAIAERYLELLHRLVPDRATAAAGDVVPDVVSNNR